MIHDNEELGMNVYQEKILGVIYTHKQTAVSASL